MALARLDIHYDQAGLTVRTGWGHAASPGPSSPATGGDAAALRQELASLRGEIAAPRRGAGHDRDRDVSRRWPATPARGGDAGVDGNGRRRGR